MLGSVHVLVHVTSLITMIVLLGQVGSKLEKDGVSATNSALLLSFVSLLGGIASILGLSAFTRRPFQYSFGITAIVFFFLASYGLLLLSAVHISSAMDDKHNARTTVLFSVLFQSIGLSMVFASIASGIAATIPSDAKLTAIATSAATGSTATNQTPM